MMYVYNQLSKNLAIFVRKIIFFYQKIKNVRSLNLSHYLSN